RRPYVFANRDATPPEDALRRRGERKSLDPFPERAEIRPGQAPHGGSDLARKGGRQPGNRPCGAGAQALRDQGLGPDEDVQAFEEIRLEPLPRPVGDLQPGKVLHALTEVPLGAAREPLTPPPRRPLD